MGLEPPDRKTLQKDVDEILYWVWDPIGVNNTFNARGEYESYAAKVVGILVQDVPEEEKKRSITDYLDGVVSDAMGLGSSPLAHRATVERLLDAYAAWKSGFR